MRGGKIVFTFNSVKFELSGLIRVASLFLFEFALCCSGDMNLIYFRVTTTSKFNTASVHGNSSANRHELSTYNRTSDTCT